MLSDFPDDIFRSLGQTITAFYHYQNRILLTFHHYKYLVFPFDNPPLGGEVTLCCLLQGTEFRLNERELQITHQFQKLTTHFKNATTLSEFLVSWKLNCKTRYWSKKCYNNDIELRMFHKLGNGNLT